MQLLGGRHGGCDGAPAGHQRGADAAGGVQLRRQVADAGRQAGPPLRQEVK